MQSRQETGRLLRESGVAVTEFRSSIIIGSGSISFELIRYLTTWFPFIPAPLQTNQPGQPIGIKDLMQVLTSALEDSRCRGQIIEIGGPEVMKYPDIMAQYAKAKGLNRPKINIPFFPVSMSARIADLLTPVPYEIAYPLMQELEAPSVVRVDPEKEAIYDLQSLSPYDKSLHYAISREEYGNRFSLLGSLITRDPLAGSHVRTTGEGFLIEHREMNHVALSDFGKRLFKGGFEKDWELDEIHPGDWIRIKRCFKETGKFFIEIHVKDERITQTALFEPNGLIGLLWWYCLLPFHSFQLRRLFMKLTGNN